MLIRRHGLLVVAVLFLGMGGLSGCAETRIALGYDKTAPDEFRVIKRAPLKMLETFDLPPPAPGMQRPQEQPPAAQVYQILTGRSLPSQNDIADGFPLPGLHAFLRATNIHYVPSDVRAIVDREAVTTLLEQHSITDRIVFWREVIYEGGPVVDAEKERRRLQENQALGYPLNKGEVPVQMPRRKGILEHLF